MRGSAVMRIMDGNPEDNPAVLTLIEDLLQSGHAKLKIGREIRQELDRTLDIAGEFYASPLPEKRRFADPGFVEGYRDIGLEYSATADRPDLTESFSHWTRNRARTEAAGWTKDCSLHRQVRKTIDALSVPVEELFQAMADRWAPGTSAPRFAKGSYLQVNYYEPAQHRRDMLQDGHEDGHLITLVTATGPGLEIKIGDRYYPVELADDEMLIMPGGLLAMMTGNAIPPLYHQVRNSFRKEPRISMMFFVNPETDRHIEPWIRNESNAGVDIVAEANAQPLKFGLPTLEAGTAGKGR